MSRPANAIARAAMRRIVVDVADMQLSTDPSSYLATYALGSCIAVCLYDPVQIAAGMIHYMLPLAKVSPEKAERNPAMFADTGIPLLFRRMYDLGCKKQNLIVKVVGGGSLYDDNGMFNIGQRNYTVLRKLFWKNSVVIKAEDVGGARSRTVKLTVGTGELAVLSQGEEVQL